MSDSVPLQPDRLKGLSTPSVFIPETIQPLGASEPRTTQQELRTGRGRYELLAEVAHGGMGIVYRAIDSILHREVAVKVLQERFGPHSDAAIRFVEEARITGRLQHPGIPAVHDLGTLDDGRPFLAMKLIRGHTLDQLVRARQDQDQDRTVLITAFEQICQAIGYAHSEGILHRDLKPANIMVGAFGEVQVMDWGLAKELRRASRGDSRPSATQDREPDHDYPDEGTGTYVGQAGLHTPHTAETMAGSVLGTPAFMPPEQANGAIHRVDRRSDVFGLGGILCTILTGRPTYIATDGESTLQLAASANLRETYARLDTCGAEAELITLCRRCLAAEPDDRPAHAGQVATAVAELRATAEARARSAEIERARYESAAREQRKRQRIQLAFAVAVGLLALGGVAFTWWQERQSSARQAERERNASEKRAAELGLQVEDERRAAVERSRHQRNSDAISFLLVQCETALRADDLEQAEAYVKAAEQRFPEGGAEHLENRGARCRADLELCRALDRIDTMRWMMVDGDWVPIEQFKDEWAKAFADWGLLPGITPLGAFMDRLRDCPIRERVFYSLDIWLVHTRSKELLLFLKTADPNPYRNVVRDAIVEGREGRAKILASQDIGLHQPPRFAAVLGGLIDVPTDRSRLILEAALQKQPSSFGLLMTRASRQFEWNEAAWNDSEIWYRAAIVAKPSNAMAHHNLGLVLTLKKDYVTAISELKTARKLDPRDPNIEKTLTMALTAAGRYQEAVVVYRQMIQKYPELSDAHFGLAVALAGLNDVDGAIESYREVIRLTPNNPRAHNNLGSQLLKKGEVQEAISEYRTAVGLDSSDPILHGNLGSVLTELGDLDEAIEHLETAVCLDPNNPQRQKSLERARQAKIARDATNLKTAPPPREVRPK